MSDIKMVFSVPKHMVSECPQVINLMGVNTWIVHPIETAPKDREILVYNPMEGWYRTRYEVDGADDRSCWPLYRNLHHSSLPDQRAHGEASVWYPWPTHWREKWEPKP